MLLLVQGLSRDNMVEKELVACFRQGMDGTIMLNLLEEADVMRSFREDKSEG